MTVLLPYSWLAHRKRKDTGQPRICATEDESSRDTGAALLGLGKHSCIPFSGCWCSYIEVGVPPERTPHQSCTAL